MAVDWNSPAAQLKTLAGAGDGVATLLLQPLKAAGTALDQATSGRFSNTETAAHAAWRPVIVTLLTRRDRLAATVDNLPLTTIDPANPAASVPVIKARLEKARARVGSHDARVAAINAAISATYPSEPKIYEGISDETAKRVAELERTLKGLVDAANVYLAVTP